MTARRPKLRELAVLSVVAFMNVAGCPNLPTENTEPDDETPSPEETPTAEPTPTTSGLPVVVEFPTGLTFAHTVGVTNCPQALGDITITNNGTDPGDIAVTFQGLPDVGGPPETITADPSTTTVPANGGTATVAVDFTCLHATDFTSTVDVAVTIGTDSETSTGNIAGTFD